MKRLLTLLLLVGAIAGLLGTQAAFAFVPAPAAAQPMAMSAQDMSDMDCAMMMPGHARPDAAAGSPPCKGMTLACIAQMGCALPILPGDGPAPMAMSPATPARFLAGSASPLAGRSYGPEPEPPSIFG